ncbi:iron-sulfur cluster loop [Candidatus Cryosericum terrychapinii]|uniref:Iron-sulfur cluster loop n=1 Tax=Candidatus Cryosericum terrychapinii TaxID=2290919 RepID=A0A398CVQ7_9BACT|nr:iron-sulfur cluster loop [Candidatus Cryosericum terrychapinii]RIE06792.1 iron-sulfur cluster loop [Candidatus Cryosericum terrychapinii]
MGQADLVILHDGLAAQALDILSKPAISYPFAVPAAADELVKDLKGHPHAYVIACMMDRQVNAEKAWGIPFELQRQERLGSFEFSFLLQQSEERLEYAMLHPRPLHRFNALMATSMYAAIHRINDEYDGNARAIWAGRPSSRVLVHRFLEFRGMGPKIANMAVNILYRDLRVELADCSSIDISADVQVTRVYARMGFVPQDASIEDVIYHAREMYPEYPGIYGLILWDLGRTKCRPQNPACTSCEWAAHCAYAKGDHTSLA